jgi:F0F1-type ATP synthase assembly protein I
MSLNNAPGEQPKKNPPVGNLALYSVGAQVGCATLVIILVGLFIGIGLDRLLNTKAVFTLLFTLGSAPLSIYVTYKLAMRAVKNISPQPAEGRQTGSEEEDDKGERSKA